MNLNLHLKIKMSFLQKMMTFLLSIGICASTLHAGANELIEDGYALQLTKRITLDMKNATVREVIYAIQKQSAIDIFIQDSEIDKLPRIDFTIKEMTVKDALTKLLDETNYTFNSKGDGVAIFKQQKESLKKITVKGKVIDERKNPIAGATIIVGSTTQGAITDMRGEFSITVLPESILDVSCVGYLPLKYVAKEDKADLILDMKLDIVNVEDVVVTGYQTISKERVTGSYDILSKEQIQKPTSNIGTALVGTVPGLQATLDIEGNPEFEIRGKSSLYANASPLIVVDGFAIEGDLKSINPNDVETITVLKDAAAASIWGARSANGVIIITTKGESAGRERLNVEINTFWKFSPKADLEYTLGLANAGDRMKFQDLGYMKWGSSPTSDSERSVGSSMDPYLTLRSENHLGYVSDAQLAEAVKKFSGMDNKGQLKKYLFDNPFTQQYNLRISSSSNKVANNLSMMYEGRDFHLQGNDDQKVMINYRNSTQIFKWLNFRFSGMFQYTDRNDNSVGVGEMKLFAPYEMLVDEKTGDKLPVASQSYYMPNIERYWPMEKFPYSDLSYNPITEMENTTKRTIAINSRFQAALELKLMEGLRVNSQLQYELVNRSYKDLYGEETFFTRDLVDKYTHWDRAANTFTLNIPKGDILDQRKDEVRTLTIRNQIDFNRTFGKHAINAVIGAETINRVTEGFTYSRTYGYSDETLSVGNLPNGYGSNSNSNLKIYNWMGNSTTITDNVYNTFKYNTDRFFSLFFNAAYTFDDKYTLSGSARTDASNMISDDPKYRYSPFWSIGGSWNVRNEKFMEEVDWVNRLILRVTFGYNGNVDNSTSFSTLINMKPTVDTDTYEPYATISSYGNPSLRWEKTGIWNIGVDYNFFDGRLAGKIDFYNKDAKDLIAAVSIPMVNGTNSQKMNVGNMNNKGIEVEIGTNLPIYQNKIGLTASLNFACNQNKVTKYYVSKYIQGAILPTAGLATSFVEGMNANTIFGSEYAGLYNSGTAENPNMQPRVVDKNGNYHSLSQWAPVDPMDLAIAQGTTVAPWVGGFSFGLKVYDFSLSCIMTGKFGHVFRRTSYNYYSGNPNGRLNEVLNGNPEKILPLPQNDVESRYFFWDRYWTTFTYLTENANHFRMQEINLRYILPTKLVRKLGLSMVEVYGQTNNVFSIYSNDYKEDPEYLYGSYKPTISYTFGIKIGF